MSSPKEKAVQLIGKMKRSLCSDDMFNAKRCSLITVEEIKDAIDWHKFEYPNKEFEYWQEVKTEIENL